MSDIEYPVWSVVTVTAAAFEIDGTLQIEYPLVQIIKLGKNGREIQFAGTLDNVFISRIDQQVTAL